MKTGKVIRCASCKKRILDQESDLVLEDVAGGWKRRYYHERCRSAAYQLAMEQPTVYVLKVRRVEASRN